MACPGCGALTERVRAFCERRPADVPVDGRRVVLRLRRLRCTAPEYARQTFREQVPGVLEPYQRRTVRLTAQLRAVVRELAGRGSARLLPALGVKTGRDAALRALMGIPLPDRPVPEVLGIDDFALRRSRQYATVLIDASTGARIDVVPGRRAAAVTAWLCAHPGARLFCRDDSATYAQTITDANPGAVQISDRWHLWHGLDEAVLKEVAAHSACWAGSTRLQDGPRAATTAEQWQQVHELTDNGVGELECARRLNLGLNTVKRYARAAEPETLRRAPQYRPTLMAPYREHLQRRRAEESGVPTTQLPEEIRLLGYPGSANLLVRYLNQGRAEQRPHLSPRRAACLLLTRPARLSPAQQEYRDELARSCPEMTGLQALIRDFAALLTPRAENAPALEAWCDAAQAAELPNMRSFVRGLRTDHAAATAAVTLPHHNGRTEGVNTRTKMIKRQMYGRASFELLRHPILLA